MTNLIAKIKNISAPIIAKVITKAKQLQQPMIDWAHSLPFPIKIFVGVFTLLLGLFGFTNPLVPGWFFFPIGVQVLFSQRKSIARVTVDFKQKTVRYVEKKRSKIIRKTKKLGNCSLYKQCIYKQRLHNLLHIND